jgi:hypothetical protein
MGDQPTKTELWGKPQGNEFLFENHIMRHESEGVSVIGCFQTIQEACDAYREWVEENNE